MRTSADFSESAIDIETSLDRVLDCGSERFAGQFYQLLFEGFPELKEFFLGVNMQHQAAMLTMALQVIVQHYRKSESWWIINGGGELKQANGAERC